MFKRNVPSPISRLSLLGVSALVLATLLTSASSVRAQYPGGGPPGGYPQPAHWEKVVTPSGTNTWSNTYGGSTNSGSSPWPTTWYPNGGFYTYQMGYVSPGYYTQTNSASVSCSGSVHFKFTWVAPNGEKAPKQVITNKSASASWSAPAVNGGGSCSTSLGGPTQSWVNGGSVSDQTYTVMDGSSGIVEFDIALSANAYGSSSMTVPNSSGNVVANVSCDANVTSVRVLLGGFQHDPVPLGTTLWQCLVGDTITANLDTGTYPQLSPSWNWSATGPVFKDFHVTANDATGKRRYHEAADKNKGTFTLHYYDKGTSVVTCTAQVVTPKGNLTVTGESETITIVRPTTVWTILDGAVKITNNNVVAATSRAATPGNPASPAGQDWTAVVTVPAPFATRQCDVGYAQLWNPSRRILTTDAPPNNVWGYPGNGQFGLDNWFPYKIWSNGGQWVTGAGTITANTSDTPWNSLFGTSATIADSFQTWVIFRPGSGQWVSLQKDTWQWSASCSPDLWDIWDFDATPTLSHTAPVDTTAHPEWTRRHLNGDFGPIGP